MKNIALVGTTGYLGKHIAIELNKRGYEPTILTRRWDKELDSKIKSKEVFKVDVTNPKTLEKKLLNIDIMISSLGITKQKDNFTYMDIDYQANLNILQEAKKSGVKKFIYISALHGDSLRDIKIFEAKEKFVDELKKSGLEYIIIRPTGFFSDMKDFLEMANKGTIYLFGDGGKKLNPISGKDLAEVCISSMENSSNMEVEIGGKKIYTHKELAKLAFKILKKKEKIIFLPDFLRIAILKLLPLFTSIKTYGVIEFFLTVISIDMVAKKYGNDSLEDFFILISEI